MPRPGFGQCRSYPSPLRFDKIPSMTHSANASGDSNAGPLTLDAAARVAASAEELAGALRRSDTISKYPKKLGRYEVQRYWRRFVSAIEATPRRIVTEPADGGWPPLSGANLLHVMCRCKDEVQQWLDEKTPHTPPTDVIDNLDRTADELRSLVKAYTENDQPPDREKKHLLTTAVTLREFMKEYCEPLTKNLLNRRLRSLGSASCTSSTTMVIQGR